MENPIEKRFKELCFQIEHLENQIRNTFNFDEKDKYKTQLLILRREIDVLLDEHNMRVRQKSLPVA
jgi:hypothetical protein